MNLEFAVVTNTCDEFTNWMRTTSIPLKIVNNKIYNKNGTIRYVSIINEDMVIGFTFNGIIVTDYINKNTENYQKIINSIVPCFAR